MPMTAHSHHYTSRVNEVKPRRQSYTWMRIRWGRLASVALPFAAVIASVSSSGSAWFGVFFVAWATVMVFFFVVILAQCKVEFGSFRALELARRTDATRQARAKRRAQAWANAISGVPLRKIDRGSIREGKLLVWAVQKRDRTHFDQYYAAGNFKTDSSSRADLMTIGIGLLSTTAGRRVAFRRPPPALVDRDVLHRIFGPDSAFADLAFEPFAAQLLLAASPLAEPGDQSIDPIVLASEIGATTCFLVGTTAFLMDIEAAKADTDRVYLTSLRQFRAQFGVKKRPVPV